MSTLRSPSAPAYDPFGEPMDLPRVCTDAKGYGETRRAAVVFWALVVLFVGGRVLLSEPPAVPGATAHAPAAIQVSVLP